MAKRSAYQQRVIRNYYKNKDAIMLQRLGERPDRLEKGFAEAGEERSLHDRASAWDRAWDCSGKGIVAHGPGSANPLTPSAGTHMKL